MTILLHHCRLFRSHDSHPTHLGTDDAFEGSVSDSKLRRYFLAIIGPWWLLLSAPTQTHSCLPGPSFWRPGVVLMAQIAIRPTNLHHTVCELITEPTHWTRFDQCAAETDVGLGTSRREATPFCVTYLTVGSQRLPPYFTCVISGPSYGPNTLIKSLNGEILEPRDNINTNSNTRVKSEHKRHLVCSFSSSREEMT